MELERLRRPIASALEDVVRVFDEELRSDWPFVRDLCARAAGYRGKMLRPTLLLLAGQACGRRVHEHIVLAAVIEMVHVATLVHDDVLDEADLRRHEPSINRLAGNEAAVLLGDFLISHAYHLCSSLGSQRDARRVAAATNRVCEGELMQVHLRGRWDLDESTYLEIILRKTAELTRLACEMGAAHAGASPEVVERFARFGDEVGIAFQIMDDLLDLTADDRQTGKSTGRDGELEKATLPVIRFLSAAPERGRRELIEILRGSRESRAQRLAALAGWPDALEYASQVARRRLHGALAQLEGLPSNESLQTLRAAAEFVVNRRC